VSLIDPSMLWLRARLAVVDVEGNGQHPPDLVELAVVPIRAGRVHPARTWLVRPPKAITWRARDIHGITNDDVASSPTITEIEGEVLQELAGVDIIVGHGVHVDRAVLSRSFGSWEPPPEVDTLRLARAAYPDMPSHKLGDLVDALGLASDPVPGQPHRAGWDGTVTARLLLRLIQEMAQPVTLGDLVRPGLKPAADAPHQEQLDLTDL